MPVGAGGGVGRSGGRSGWLKGGRARRAAEPEARGARPGGIIPGGPGAGEVPRGLSVGMVGGPGGGGLRAGGEIGQLGGGAGEVRRGPKWALVGRLASWYGVANPPNTRYIYFRCVVVNTTGNMDHRERDIYISILMPPRRSRAGIPRGGGPPGAPWGARPRRHARRTHHVTLRIFKRLSPPKIRNVTQLFEKVAHFVWCFCRARTTPIQKLSPAAISSHFNCILDFYIPNGVGESV